MWYQRSSAWYTALDADCIELLSRLPAATDPGGLLVRRVMNWCPLVSYPAALSASLMDCSASSSLSCNPLSLSARVHLLAAALWCPRTITRSSRGRFFVFVVARYSP